MDLTGDIFLTAKAAAHQLPDDAHALLGPAERRSDLLPVGVGDLRANINLHAPIRGRAGNAAFRLQKGMFRDGSVEGVLEDHIGLSKAVLHIPFADFDVLEQVAGGMQGGCIRLARLHRIGDHR